MASLYILMVDLTHYPSCLQDLKATGTTLKGILETHFHADFVSGHYELMQKTGATIYFGPTAGSRCKFPHHELKDGEVHIKQC